MKNICRVLAAPAALFAAAALMNPVTALAADPSDAAPACKDIIYDVEFLQAYPRAPAACQEVVESQGKRAVRFAATVTRVRKDHIQLQFLNVSGKPIEPVQTLTLLPQPGQTMHKDGKHVPYSSLSKGDTVDFWVPEKQLGVITNPNTMAVSTIVLP
jgi:hypothetical protein